MARKAFADRYVCPLALTKLRDHRAKSAYKKSTYQYQTGIHHYSLSPEVWAKMSNAYNTISSSSSTVTITALQQPIVSSSNWKVSLLPQQSGVSSSNWKVSLMPLQATKIDIDYATIQVTNCKQK